MKVDFVLATSWTEVPKVEFGSLRRRHLALVTSTEVPMEGFGSLHHHQSNGKEPWG